MGSLPDNLRSGVQMLMQVEPPSALPVPTQRDTPRGAGWALIPGAGPMGTASTASCLLSPSSDAFDFKYGVCLLRMKEGLNISRVVQAHSECRERGPMGLVPTQRLQWDVTAGLGMGVCVPGAAR